MSKNERAAKSVIGLEEDKKIKAVSSVIDYSRKPASAAPAAKSDGMSSPVDGTKETGLSKGASRAAKTAAGGGSVEDIAASGLMATGNPVAIGVGAALSLASSSKKREQANEELKYKAKLERISRQSVALNNLTNVSNSLRKL